MSNIQIHPIAYIIIGLSLCCMNRKKVDTSSIVGECLAIVLCLSIYPLVKWGIGEYFGSFEIVDFGVYCRVMMMVMVGRVVRWVRG